MASNVTSAEFGNDTVNGNQQPPTEAFIIFVVFSSTIAVVTVFGNALVLTAVGRFSALRNYGNYLLASMAVADILYSISALAHKVIKLHERMNPIASQTSCEFCSPSYSVIRLCKTCSFGHLFLICIERYVTIIRPMDYNRWVTDRTVAGSIAAVWIVSGAKVAFIALQKSTQINTAGAVLVGAIFYFPSIVLVIVYLHIWRVATRQFRQISASQCQPDPGNAQQLKHATQQNKATITIGLVLIVFLCTWGPQFILLQVFTACPSCLSPPAWKICDQILLIGAAINPVIYALRLKTFRRAFHLVLTCSEGNVV